MRILVIDDSYVMRRIIKNILETIDDTYDIFESENGGKCLDVLEEGEFDLIILDIPFIEGLNALKNIKAKSNNAKIIICTMESSKNYIMKAVKFGADEYIVKPFNKEVFKQKMFKLKRLI